MKKYLSLTCIILAMSTPRAFAATAAQCDFQGSQAANAKFGSFQGASWFREYRYQIASCLGHSERHARLLSRALDPLCSGFVVYGNKFSSDPDDLMLTAEVNTGNLLALSCDEAVTLAFRKLASEELEESFSIRSEISNSYMPSYILF